MALAFTIGFTGLNADRLQAAAAKVRPALTGAMREIMNDVWRRASKKVSGDVLKVRTGHLRRTLGPPQVKAVLTGVEGTLGAGAIYARIHEEGGTIPAHTIRPRFAQVLRWIGPGGRPVFAKSVNIPAIRMPKRAFLAPSLTEALPPARRRLEQVMIRTINEA